MTNNYCPDCKQCRIRRKIIEYAKTTFPALVRYREIARYTGETKYPQTIKNHIENLIAEGLLVERFSECGHEKYLIPSHNQND